MKAPGAFLAISTRLIGPAAARRVHPSKSENRKAMTLQIVEEQLTADRRAAAPTDRPQ